MRLQCQRTTNRSLIVLTAVLSITPSILARPTDPLQFRRYSVEHGLSQSSVNCVVQDHEGYVWFGTQDGLNKFDGMSFRVYRTRAGDSSSLSDDNITALLVDHTGALWVGTYAGGLNWFNPETETFRRFPHRPKDTNSPSGNSIMALAEDSSGILWVATWMRGLNAFNLVTGVWTRYSKQLCPGEIPDDRMTSLAIDGNNRVWIGTWSGLATFDRPKGRFRTLPGTSTTDARAQGRRIFCLLPDTRNHLWIGMFEDGLECLDTRTNTTIPYSTSGASGKRLSGMTVRALALDADTVLWIGTQEGGVNRLDLATGTITIDRSGPIPALSADRVLSLFRDRERTMWVGVDGGGVNHYDPLRTRFRHIRYEPGRPASLANPVVRALCEDRDGKLWIGSAGGGLDCYDPDGRTMTHSVASPGRAGRLSSNTVMALLEDSDGMIWIGTSGTGIDRMDKRRVFQNFRLPREQGESVGPDYVMAFMESRDGVLWVGTIGGGLFELDRTTLRSQRYSLTTGAGEYQIASNFIYALMEDRLGRIWIGTWGAGVSVLDRARKTFVHYRHADTVGASLSNNTIHAFHEDTQGTVWIATAGGGLDAFNRRDETFAHLTEADGLPNNVIYAVLDDANGDLWLSTNKGVCCFNPAMRTFRNYGMADGLQSFEFNQGAYCTGRKGMMYFGGINGVNMFDPMTLPIDTLPPPIRISQCRIFDSPAPQPDADGVIRLPASDNSVAFEYTALDYTSPELNSYRSMLEGVDARWTEASTRRFASYANLASGEYLFRVVGSNSDRTWNEKGASLRIHIASPYWETLWFRTLVLLVLGSVAVFGYRTRINRLRREKALQSEFSRRLNESQEAERKRIAGELHDGLGQDLLTISHSLDRIPPGAIPASLASVLGEAIRQSIDGVRQIAADLHPHMLERLGLTRTVEATVRRMAEAASLTVTMSIDPVDNLFTPFEEINIYRIVQEALNNVIKHSHASLCQISMVREKDHTVLSIMDDGRGFDAAEGSPGESTGRGLVNMAERIRLLEGDMAIESVPGQGTTVRFSIPMRPKSRAGAR